MYEAVYLVVRLAVRSQFFVWSACARIVISGLALCVCDIF